MNLRITKKGFTVIDLMMTLAVAAVLLALAIPSFNTLALNKRITAQTNEFLSSLALARSEALKRVSPVTVCRSANGTTCANSGGWEQGWIVFNDKDKDAQVDSTGNAATNEPILKYVTTLPGSNTLRGSTNVASYISFVSSGSTQLTSGAAQLGTLVLCDERGAGDHARIVSLSITGRSRVTSTAPTSCGT